MQSYSQDPDAHLYYDVDWTKWLSARGLEASDISGFTWTVPETITKTQEVANGAIARVYLKQPTLNRTSTITCQITVANPDAGMEDVYDQYSFKIVGSQA